MAKRHFRDRPSFPELSQAYPAASMEDRKGFPFQPSQDAQQHNYRYRNTFLRKNCENIMRIMEILTIGMPQRISA